MPAGTRPTRAERGTATSGTSIGGRLLSWFGALALLPLAVAGAGIAGGADATLLALGGLGTLLALGVMTVSINRNIVRRLRELAAASGRLRSGELHAAVPVEGADELTEFAGALEALRRNALALHGSESRLRAQRRAFARLQREFEVFLDVASQDLKAPLRAIDNLTGFLREDLDATLTADSRRHLELLQSRVARLDALLDAVLDYARAGSRPAPREAVDLRELVDTAISLTCPAEVPVLINGSFGRVSTWRAPLERVVRDLLEYACLRNDDTRGPLSIDCVLKRRELRLVVADYGAGIAPELHERIFAPFESFEACVGGGGNGAGLAVAKKLVETCGGSIDIRSDPARDCGAAFVISWPIDAVLTPASLAAARPDPMAAIAGAL